MDVLRPRLTDAQLQRLARTLGDPEPASEIHADLAPRAGHPSPWAIECYAGDGVGDPETVAHIASCLPCRREVAAFRGGLANGSGVTTHVPAAAAASVAREVASLQDGPRGRALIKIVIATTEGPAVVTGLASLAPPCRSMMIRPDTGEEVLGPAASPNSYDDFVRLESGIVERLFGRAPFLLEISRSIDTGESWQAGVLLAHAAHARERFGVDDDYDIAAWVTGVVDPADFTLLPVAHIAEKLSQSLAFFAAASASGRRRVAFVPYENQGDLDRLDERLRRQLDGVELHAVRTAGEMFALLRLRGTEDRSPYRGLFRFEQEDRSLFFGRRQNVAVALQRLREGEAAGRPFLLISGPSGVGKSSLARAGILNSVDQLPADTGWRTAILDLQQVPADDLLRSLADILGVSPVVGPAQLAAAASTALRGQRLLLLVDQLEQLFTRGASPASVAAFANALAALTASGAVWVVATMRPDFMPQLRASPALTELVRERDYALWPPGREELREIIAGPMRLWGLTAGTDPQRRNLVDVMLDEAVPGFGALPLLQYTLDVLVRQLGHSRELSWQAYAKLGGLTGAIGRRVEEELEPLGGLEAVRPDLDALIRCLAHIDYRSGAAVARRAPLTDMSGLNQALVDLLVRLRLIVVDDTAMHVAHEALLTQWSVACDVLRRDGVELVLREQLEQQAAQWRNALPADKRSRLLPPGKPLADGVDLLERRRSELPDRIIDFIAASRQRDVEERAEEQRQRAAQTSRFAQDEQRALDRIARGEFVAAAEHLRELGQFLDHVRSPELQARRADVASRHDRIARLAGFFTAAREADTLAGQEEFDRALPKCEQALSYLAIDDPAWLDRLPLQDVADNPVQVRRLEQEAYRTLLLYSGILLVPGIRKLEFGDQRPALPRRLAAIGRFLLPLAITRIGPWALPRVLARGGLFGFRLPTRRDRPAALADFAHIRTVLDRVGALEARFGNDGAASRTSQLVRQLVELFTEISSAPAGALIDYRKWLLGGWSGPPPAPINGADYFFIGLLNYFVAKRRDTMIPRVLVLLRGRFPDIDGADPVGTANRLLRTAVALEPQNFWAHWLLGRTLLVAEDFAGAELAFNAAVSLRPSYARGYEQRALALAQQWQQRSHPDLRTRALADAEAARGFAEGDPSVFWPRGEALERLGDLSGALASWALWLELEENIPSLIARASGLGELERRTTALIAAGRERAAALAVRAHVRLIREDFEGAAIDAERALLAAPDHPRALTAQGMLARRRGDPAAALELLNRAISADPSGTYRARYERACIVDSREGWQALVEESRLAAVNRCPPWMLAKRTA